MREYFYGMWLDSPLALESETPSFLLDKALIKLLFGRFPAFVSHKFDHGYDVSFYY